jgi:hypothetical protein
MVAPTVEVPGPKVGTFSEPPCPLTPELRSDIAYRRARGEGWDSLGVVFRYSCDALRRACENDPDFAAAQEKAWAQVTWEGEADGMRRLRFVANHSDDDAKAMKAAEVLVKYARERRRDDTRLACERLRAETRRAAEAARAERRAAPAQEDVVWAGPRWPAPETEEEKRKRFDREHAARAALPKAYVYVWGGKHPLGRSHGPDGTDTRVRLKYDASCGEGARGIVYWVVRDSESLEPVTPGEPKAAEAFAGVSGSA